MERSSVFVRAWWKFLHKSYVRFSYLCKFGLKTCCLPPNFLDDSKIKIEQNSLIYFNNLLNFYLTKTIVGRHDKKYTNYDMYNTILQHTYYIMHTHIPHYAHITDMHKILTHNKIKHFRSSSFGLQNIFQTFHLHNFSVL